MRTTRYMASFDPRLLRPRVIPTLARIALTIVVAIERWRASRPKRGAALDELMVLEFEVDERRRNAWP